MTLRSYLSTFFDSGGHTLLINRRTSREEFWTIENFKKPQTILLMITALLCAVGIVMIFSASSVNEVLEGGSGWGSLISHLVALSLGVIGCYIVSRTNSAFWTSNRTIAFAWIITIILLIFVRIIGISAGGAKRWMALGPITIQPSEFAKIIIVLIAARLCEEWRTGRISVLRFASLLAIFTLIPMILILLQKDLGTIIIIVSSLVFLAIMAGVNWSVMIAAFIVIVPIGFLLINHQIYRLQRLSIWIRMVFGMEYDRYNEGYQMTQSLQAFSTGGFFGRGLGNSAQKYQYLPEAHNDFIFSVIGEELGFIGCLFVVLLFAAFAIVGLRIALTTEKRSIADSLVVSGFTSVIVFQAFLNMGGVTNLIPLSGRPLPFISAGGTSIIVMLLMVGLIVSIARETEEWNYMHMVEAAHPQSSTSRRQRRNEAR